MCRRVTCPKCHRPTFAGCGAHVERVLAEVPQEDRCQCATNSPRKGKREERAAPPRTGAAKTSWWQKLLSR
jgi:hypothetical protein